MDLYPNHYLFLLESDFFIDRSHHDEALKAIKRLPQQHPDVFGSVSCFVWRDQLARATTLEEAMRFYNWPVTLQDGHVVGIHFADNLDDFEGEYDLLFAALVPYVRRGSWIRLLNYRFDVVTWHFETDALRAELKGNVLDDDPADRWTILPESARLVRQVRSQLLLQVSDALIQNFPGESEYVIRQLYKYFNWRGKLHGAVNGVPAATAV